MEQILDISYYEVSFLLIHYKLIPKGNKSLKKVELSLYCRKWNDFSTVPVELHVLNKPLKTVEKLCEKYEKLWESKY